MKTIKIITEEITGTETRVLSNHMVNRYLRILKVMMPSEINELVDAVEEDLRKTARWLLRAKTNCDIITDIKTETHDETFAKTEGQNRISALLEAGFEVTTISYEPKMVTYILVREAKEQAFNVEASMQVLRECLLKHKKVNLLRAVV